MVQFFSGPLVNMTVQNLARTLISRTCTQYEPIWAVKRETSYE